MVIYPAIDIKQGKCVRLVQGRFSDVTVYSDNPVEVAKRWKNAGAEYIHLVDLDGALLGESVNSEVIKNIVQAVDIPIQIGGGIRKLDTVKTLLDMGVSRVILGTAAVKDPEFIERAIQRYGDKIAIGIDAKDGKVAVDGWEQVSSVNAIDLASKMERIGAKTIIYTDISKDGMLQGPNLGAMKEMADKLSIDVIASGGVTTLNDIVELKTTGVQGVIVGKALYVGNIKLEDALNKAKG